MRKLVIWMLLTLGVLGGLMPVVAQNNTMQLRVAHWSSDAPPVDIYANGERVIESLEYPTVTVWMELEAGLYDIAIAPAGTSLDEAVIGPLTFNLVRGTWITIAAVGSVEAGTLATNVLIEDYSPMLARDAESARVSITHAVDGAAPITMMINDIVATTSLAYPGTKGNNDGFFVRNIPAGVADIQVFLTNQPDVEVASASDVTLEAGMNYLLAAVGTADAPELLIVASSFDGEMMMMSDVGTIATDNTASDETMTEADTSTDEVIAETPTPEADETVDEEVTPEAEATEAPVATEVTSELEMTEEPMMDESMPDAEMTEEPMMDESMPDAEMTEEPAMDESMPDAEMTEEPMMDESMPDAEMTEEPMMDESMPDAEMTEEPMMDESMPDAEMTEEPMMDESMPDAEMTEEPAMDESMPDAEMTEEPMATEDAMDADMSEISNTIADIVVATEANDAEFSVLLAALMVADESIAETLGDPDADLTVFAPTDEAFVALLEDMDIDIDTLLSDTDLLNTVLPYHVVEGAVMADTVMTMDGEAVPTLLGDDATISIAVTDDGVILNGSIHVIETDIVADNGVIHVIDGVLVPEMETE